MSKPESPVFEGVALSLNESKPGSAELVVVANLDFLWHARAALFLISDFEYHYVSWQHQAKRITATSKDSIPKLLEKRAKLEGRKLNKSSRKPKAICRKPLCAVCNDPGCDYRVIL